MARGYSNISAAVITVTYVTAVSAVACCCTRTRIICIGGFIGTSCAAFAASVLSQRYAYIAGAVIAISRIARVRTVICNTAVTRIRCICRLVATSSAVFPASVLACGYSHIARIIIAVARVARVRTAVACAAVASIRCIGGFIGTSCACFPVSVLARGYAYIAGAVIAVAANGYIRTAVACAAVARVICVGGFIGTSCAGFPASVLARRYSYIGAAIIAVACITRIRARVGCAARAGICSVGGFIGTSRAVFSVSPIARGYGYIGGTVITISAVAAVSAGIGCAAIACIRSIGRLVCTSGAGFSISVIAYRGSDTS